MKIYTLDFETYYDKDYSLRKMQTDAYIMDDRYETIMVCIIDEQDKEDIIVGSELEIAAQLRTYANWEECAIRAHNTLFDGYILSYRYGIKPKLWMDTLSQARMFLPYLKSHSLANVAKYLGIGAKGNAVHNGG